MEIESEALASLAGSLDQSFDDAVTALMSIKGRIIVSGLGKSGHIARKIVATLASTGSPAQHVHPSEASHGDLGMITRQDAVIMFSNSGENNELSDLIIHTRRAQIPLIGVSSKPESTLIKQSDIGLILPEAPEACLMGMAPTTSSTMMLALGDALAVALMERRGFSADDYKVLHPGGQLGKSLIRVSEIMHVDDKMPLVNGDGPLPDLLNILIEKRFGIAGIIDEAGGLLGVFTDGDLGRNLDRQMFDKSIFDIMTRDPRTIREGALVAEAVALMEQSKISCLFVIPDSEVGKSNPKPVGVVHVLDCMKAGFI